jgi:predicted enzyme related to lactoylglutathione lyase
VHYLVEDVPAAVAAFRAQGGEVREPPFEIAVGRCAVLADPFGNAICILDLSKGRR